MATILLRNDTPAEKTDTSADKTRADNKVSHCIHCSNLGMLFFPIVSYSPSWQPSLPILHKQENEVDGTSDADHHRPPRKSPQDHRELKQAWLVRINENKVDRHHQWRVTQISPHALTSWCVRTHNIFSIRKQITTWGVIHTISSMRASSSVERSVSHICKHLPCRSCTSKYQQQGWNIIDHQDRHHELMQYDGPYMTFRMMLESDSAIGTPPLSLFLCPSFYLTIHFVIDHSVADTDHHCFFLGSAYSNQLKVGFSFNFDSGTKTDGETQAGIGREQWRFGRREEHDEDEKRIHSWP